MSHTFDMQFEVGKNKGLLHKNSLVISVKTVVMIAENGTSVQNGSYYSRLLFNCKASNICPALTLSKNN